MNNDIDMVKANKICRRYCRTAYAGWLGSAYSYFVENLPDAEGEDDYDLSKDALLAREKSKDALVKHGRWTFVAQRFYDGGYVDIFRCSCCGIPEGKESKYCPNCGARMWWGEKK